MNYKPIFYDSDVLVCFLEIDEYEFLQKLFSKIILPKKVYDELTRKRTPKNIKDNLKYLIEQNFVEIREIEFASKEYLNYNCISKGYWSKNGEEIGSGESAAIALAIENDGIVASNNLKDITDICSDFNIPIITAPILLTFALEMKIYSKTQIDMVWEKIMNNTYQKLPKQTFKEYYDELFKEDCIELLKNYNLKNNMNCKPHD